MQSHPNKKLVLGFGAGRCGMRWFKSLVSAHRNAIGYHERFSLPEAFYRYCQWHGLPVDHEAFYRLLEEFLEKNLSQKDIVFVSSPWFTSPEGEVIQRLKPNQVIFFLRNAEESVNSFYCKGWYKDEPIRSDPEKCPGLQPSLAEYPHRSFSRVTPSNGQCPEWSSLTRTGKIAWYWGESNKRIYQMLKKINIEPWIVKLEDIQGDYEYFCRIARAMGLSKNISERRYKKISSRDRNKGKVIRTIQDWTKQEKNEFEKIILPFESIYQDLKTTTFS